MIMVMMITKYKTNKCHKFVTLMRFMRNDDDDNDDDDDDDDNDDDEEEI